MSWLKDAYNRFKSPLYFGLGILAAVGSVFGFGYFRGYKRRSEKVEREKEKALIDSYKRAKKEREEYDRDAERIDNDIREQRKKYNDIRSISNDNKRFEAIRANARRILDESKKPES
jgi:hypothetical protein